MENEKRNLYHNINIMEWHGMTECCSKMCSKRGKRLYINCELSVFFGEWRGVSK